MAEKTASWRDGLRPGSFRGVPFVTESHDHALGRRLATHEYPMREVPYTEDLGRKAREFTLELFVIGDDYMAQRDRLREALEKSGPGELVHPYLGTQTVCVREGHLRETMREGRMARFSVTFVEAGLEIAPDTKKDTAWGVGKASDALTKAGKEDFAEKFRISGPARLLSGAKAGIDKVLGGIKDTVGAPLGELKSSQDILASLFGMPSGLAGWLTDELSILGSLAPVEGASLASGLASQTLPTASATLSTPQTATATTAVQAQSQVNLAAVDNLVQQTAVAEAARASAQATYTSADEALAVRETLCEAMDTVAARSSDRVYVCIADLRAAVVLDLGTRAAQLPRLSSYPLPATTPAVVVAHMVHGDATREAEIVARNRVRHPGAVPGGTTLEVLSDARV
jgi:prophage DNA circulation protein